MTARTAGDAGHVMTVRGAIDPSALGLTLMHEHVFIDLAPWYARPADAEFGGLADLPMTDHLAPRVRLRPLGSCRDNLRLDDHAAAVRELESYASMGGSALVDCTVLGIGRAPTKLVGISEATGLHVVMGTGIYVERAHPPWVASSTVDELADLFLRDLCVGADGTGVRAGIIGEIGTSGIAAGQWEKSGAMTAEEQKVLRAAGRAAGITGAAVSVHLDPNSHGAFEVIDTLADEGVPTDRMVMCHLDAVADLEYHLDVAARGVYIEFDHFGRHYATKSAEGRFTTDTERIAFLCELLAAGHQDRLLLSQDICMKIDLVRFGGAGYGHLLRLRSTMNDAGISDAQLTRLLVDNPRRVLTLPSDLPADEPVRSET